MSKWFGFKLFSRQKNKNMSETAVEDKTEVSGSSSVSACPQPQSLGPMPSVNDSEVHTIKSLLEESKSGKKSTMAKSAAKPEKKKAELNTKQSLKVKESETIKSLLERPEHPKKPAESNDGNASKVKPLVQVKEAETIKNLLDRPESEKKPADPKKRPTGGLPGLLIQELEVIKRITKED